MTVKIYAPNENYAGSSAGVTFVNGVGETDNPYLIDWFKERGYRVDEEDIDSEEKSKKSKKQVVDMDYITDIKEDVKKYLKSLGYEVVDGDLFSLDNFIQTVKYYICNKTNQKKVPEGLKYVWLNRRILYGC